MAETHGVSGADGRVAQGLSQEALADARRSHQQHVLVLVEKLQGESGVQQATIQGNRRRPVEVLQPAGLLKTGTIEAHFDASMGATVDLVADDDLQEGSVVQLFTTGQCGSAAFAVGGQHPASVARGHAQQLGGIGDGDLVFQNGVEHAESGLLFLVQRNVLHQNIFADQLADDRIVEQEQNDTTSTGLARCRKIEDVLAGLCAFQAA